MKIFIPIDPMAAPRPRVTRNGTYNDPKYTNYKNAISLMAKSKCTISLLPIYMKIDFFFTTPKSWSQKKKDAAKWHTLKPDIDNLQKGVKDALNGIAYNDDSQVCLVQARKQYATSSGILIEIENIA